MMTSGACSVAVQYVTFLLWFLWLKEQFLFFLRNSVFVSQTQRGRHQFHLWNTYEFRQQPHTFLEIQTNLSLYLILLKMSFFMLPTNVLIPSDEREQGHRVISPVFSLNRLSAAAVWALWSRKAPKSHCSTCSLSHIVPKQLEEKPSTKTLSNGKLCGDI